MSFSRHLIARSGLCPRAVSATDCAITRFLLVQPVVTTLAALPTTTARQPRANIEMIED
jgi:hypothetical protein